eukprot:624821-Prymnesium_polylepis.1
MAQHIEEHREFRENVFDQWAYNNLLFWTDGGLDPFIERAKTAGHSYLLRKWIDPADGREPQPVFALFLHVSDNGITIQLRSRTLADEKAAEPFDPCSPFLRGVVLRSLAVFCIVSVSMRNPVLLEYKKRDRN